ncbi:molybdopterin oxidoreductase family protein [Geobacter sp. DSM 9736]|uniref:molybdopterin oxidoreductase family protein n=1 Tax=Geobacter sp. DSM 9736 TaxID=1277350 RepID=UPI000B505266|nr:molybdopterin oxidoreductase family protein [Geobacter sp. DSM 9736]SNB44630.1 Anaerobic selenocysteine-containing dehydrogenase [Geobacter sp. DSM 9736]
MTTIIRSVCPYDCPDTCGLLVHVEKDRAVRVTGDPDHPYAQGTLCPKMNDYEQTVHSPRRLLKPLIRSGEKGSGTFREATWDEALKLIALRWRKIIATHGAEAILPYSYAGTMGLIQRNAGHPFFHYLGASRLDRTICAPAKDAGLKAVLGDTPAPDPDEVLGSDLIILWGINAAATSIHFLHRSNRARKKGARVWLIDTYATHTAPAADEVFLIRPGSDGALALGLMHVLERDGLADLQFLRERTQGCERFSREVLTACTPQWTAELTGLPAETVVRLAHEYAAAKAPFIRLGSGLSRYGNGSMTVRTIAALPAFVGAYGKRHAGLLGSTSTAGAFAMNEVLREDFMKQPTRVVNMNRLGHALNDLSDPPVMSLYVYHSNPAAITPDQNAVLRGLAREDLFTVVHERFMTDTARWADVLLPATSSLEHPDIYRAYGTYCIQRAKGAIPPVGESRSNWEVFAALAEELEFHEPFFRRSAEELIDRLLQRASPLREGIDTTGLEEGKGVLLNVPPWPPARFVTPSGKIEILNESEKEPLPRYIAPHEENGKYPLRLMTAPNPFALNASFYERDDLRRKQGVMQLKVNPEEADRRGLAHGDRVIAFNCQGEVTFILETTEAVPPGTAVAEGVWWLEFAPGSRSVNALTSQRLTDRGNGSTFYDNRIDIRRE